MYVDDINLLYVASSATASDSELIEQVQEGTTDWGMLTQATGGILKPEKCRVYFLAYQFVEGKARLK